MSLAHILLALHPLSAALASVLGYAVTTGAAAAMAAAMVVWLVAGRPEVAA